MPLLSQTGLLLQNTAWGTKASPLAPTATADVLVTSTFDVLVLKVINILLARYLVLA